MPHGRKLRRPAAARTVVEVVVERPAKRRRSQRTAAMLEAAARTKQGWVARVTQRADREYDAGRGRIDWEAVATELGLPLIGCLHLFDASLSKVPVRSLPAMADWSKDDVDALRAFVSDNIDVLSGDEWRLAGVYMNARYSDCLRAYRQCGQVRMTDDMHASIAKCRESGMEWGEIYEQFPLYSNSAVLCHAFNSHTARFSGRKEPGTTFTRWEPAETERVREIIEQTYTLGRQRATVDAIASEFPDKDAVSDDPAESKAGRWTDEDMARVVDLVEGYRGSSVDWEAVGMKMGRTARSCLQKYGALHIQMQVEPQARHADAVAEEVRRQLESGPAVDWTRVSWAVGLSELDCLEICRIDDGKARWVYDPDTFSHETADRLKAFIAENYPPPTPLNTHAVSNYLWIDIKDCVRLIQLVTGEFKWTPGLYSRVIELHDQGMSFKEIARQISPYLTESRVRTCYHRIVGPRQVAVLTPEERQRGRAIIDANAGKIPYVKIRDLVREAISRPGVTVNIAGFTDGYASCHPYYRGRLEAMDRDRIFGDIESGAATAPDIARELDLPSVLLYKERRKRETERFSRRWTEREETQLLEILRNHRRPFNWDFIAAQVGTKSAQQCQGRRAHLVKNGRLDPKAGY
ncbi:hypothetical protein H4R18_002035 [Coemansia javaensis]|uniref:Myb-like domain-containing protein n=1 Tax=Coemansia javaensis TaxID=2761396 RepID=A0A9W8LIC0_9FUNG|nr:hypothetical protein H4R18_002035 [Coemansia javaensis]